MEVTLVVIFILGYLAITLEHTLKVDKLILPCHDGHNVGDSSSGAPPVFEVILPWELKTTHLEIFLHHLGKTLNYHFPTGCQDHRRNH